MLVASMLACAYAPTPIASGALSMGVAQRTAVVTQRASLLSMAADDAAGSSEEKEPLLVRACRGEEVERTPVWMMRQAGRHMAAYRALVSKYPTFRERSETPEVSLEVSLQPWNAYGVDGVILFSDILTPLPAMGVDFQISEAGGISIDPIRTREAFNRMTEHGPFDPDSAVPFVGSVLGKLREAVAGSGATVLGFVGLPFTLGTYLIEGATGTKTGFAEIRKLREEDPELTRDILSLVSASATPGAFVVFHRLWCVAGPSAEFDGAQSLCHWSRCRLLCADSVGHIYRRAPTWRLCSPVPN